MHLNEFVGNKIKTFREARGMTQDMLADKLNTTRQTISRYENGDRKANQDVLFELSVIFGVKVDDFFPKITKESFVGGSIPIGITGITYTVDLSGLNSIPLSLGDDDEV